MPFRPKVVESLLPRRNNPAFGAFPNRKSHELDHFHAADGESIQ
jgi:hypothetical protein